MAGPPEGRVGRGAVAVALALVALALYEAGTALVAPGLAPSEADWRDAAAHVDGAWQPGDLVVAAPAWADPVLRLHLGARLPSKVAGRLDHERFARVWELSQRGASALESAGGTLVEERHLGHLRTRLYQRSAKRVSFDFTERWNEAHVSRVEEGVPTQPCPLQQGQHQCPDIAYNFVRPAILEIGGGIRQALYAQPVPHATVVVEFREVPLGRELAVAGGLHNVWLRKAGSGSVLLRARVDGREVGRLESGNRTGWKLARFDTSAFAGKTGTVSFEITSANPFSRHFGFAAEARGE